MDKYQITIDTYNKTAKAFQDKFMNLDLYNNSYDAFLDRIEKPGAEVFEIACGPGNITAYLLKKRPDLKIIGIDLSSEMVKLAKANNPTADFMLMDCRDIGKLEQNFDAIVCGFCMPYLSNEECAKLIFDMYNLLNHKGLIYFSTMEGDDSRSGFETTSFSGSNEVYVHYHQADYLTEKLLEAGFTNIELARQEYPEPDGTVSTDMIFIAEKN